MGAGREGEKLPELLKEFEAANPGVKVEVTPIPWDAAHNKYQTAIAGGQTPDIAQMGTTWMGDFADAFDPAPAEFADARLLRRLDEVLRGERHQRTACRGTSTPGSSSTARISRSRPATPPRPANYDDFKAMAKAMQEKAGAKWGIQLLAGAEGSFLDFLPFGWSAGAELMNADNTAWTLDSPGSGRGA